MDIRKDRSMGTLSEIVGTARLLEFSKYFKSNKKGHLKIRRNHLQSTLAIQPKPIFAFTPSIDKEFNCFEEKESGGIRGTSIFKRIQFLPFFMGAHA